MVLVEVERLPRGEHRRKPKKLWLWWSGVSEPDLSPGTSSPTGGYPGRSLYPSHKLTPTRVLRSSLHSCQRWVRQRLHRNPAENPPADPRAAFQGQRECIVR